MGYFLIILPALMGLIVLLKDVLPEGKPQCFTIIIAIMILIISTYFQIKKEDNRIPNLIQSYHNEIDDFRYWNSQEATYRILGNIKRLGNLKEDNFNLSNCYLKSITLENIKFKDSDLSFINLTYASLRDCTFENVDFTGAQFSKANIIRCKFINCKLNRVNYVDTTIMNCDLEGSDLTSFDESNNLNLARCFYNNKNVDQALLVIIRNGKPDLLEKPTALKLTRFPNNWKVEQ